MVTDRYGLQALQNLRAAGVIAGELATSIYHYRCDNAAGQYADSRRHVAADLV